MNFYRPASERGHVNLGWLDSKHSFSFGQYHDPAHMGFAALRVINEDRVAPSAGFDTHGHTDMEIITYVLEGALEHKDSLGNGSVIQPGEVQRMTAGTGIRHSEFNASNKDQVHFLQIWIVPEKQGLTPGYEQKPFPVGANAGRLRLIGARDGREGSLTIHQDVELYDSLLREGESVAVEVRAGHKFWVQLIRGALNVTNGYTQRLTVGDGYGFTDDGLLTLVAVPEAEFLLFDFAG